MRSVLSLTVTHMKSLFISPQMPKHIPHVKSSLRTESMNGSVPFGFQSLLLYTSDLISTMMQNPTSEIQTEIVPVISVPTPPNGEVKVLNQSLLPTNAQQDVEARTSESGDEIDEEELVDTSAKHTFFDVAYFVLCLVLSFLFSFPFPVKTIEWVLSPCITYIALGLICCCSKNKARFPFALEICLFISAIVKKSVTGLVFLFAVYGIPILLLLLTPSVIICCIRGSLDTEKNKQKMSKVVTIIFLLLFTGIAAIAGYAIGNVNLIVLFLGITLFLDMFFLHISVACDTETIDNHFCHFANAYLCAIGISSLHGKMESEFAIGVIACVIVYMILFYVEFFAIK